MCTLVVVLNHLREKEKKREENPIEKEKVSGIPMSCVQRRNTHAYAGTSGIRSQKGCADPQNRNWNPIPSEISLDTVGVQQLISSCGENKRVKLFFKKNELPRGPAASTVYGWRRRAEKQSNAKREQSEAADGDDRNMPSGGKDHLGDEGDQKRPKIWLYRAITPNNTRWCDLPWSAGRPRARRGEGLHHVAARATAGDHHARTA